MIQRLKKNLYGIRYKTSVKSVKVATGSPCAGIYKGKRYLTVGGLFSFADKNIIRSNDWKMK